MEIIKFLPICQPERESLKKRERAIINEIAAHTKEVGKLKRVETFN